MSSSGTLSNYYVDSFLIHESEELVQARYGPAAPLGQAGRQATLGEHPEFTPCSFQSKTAVFSTSWNAMHHPPSASNVPAAVYHPYTVHPQAPLAAPDGRYMRSWLEPMAGSLSFPGLPASRHHYGIKPEPLPARRGDCTTFDTHALTLTDYACGSPPVAEREKAAHDGAFSETAGESDATNGDKPQLDPSKSRQGRRRPEWRRLELCGSGGGSERGRGGEGGT